MSVTSYTTPMGAAEDEPEDTAYSCQSNDTNELREGTMHLFHAWHCRPMPVHIPSSALSDKLDVFQADAIYGYGNPISRCEGQPSEDDNLGQNSEG